MIYSTVNKALVFTLCLRSSSAAKRNPIRNSQGVAGSDKINFCETEEKCSDTPEKKVYKAYNDTHNKMKGKLGTDPANLALEMADSQIPYTKEGYINLQKYDWTRQKAQKLRNEYSELIITGLELKGYEAIPAFSQDGIAWAVPVIDGFYHLVPPTFPVNLDEIDVDGREAFEGWINRNRFNEFGPYYIKQGRNESGALITNVIAKKLLLDEHGPKNRWGEPKQSLQWKYFTFGVKGQWNTSRCDVISRKLPGYKIFGNHEENTTLILKPGKVSLQKDGEVIPDYRTVVVKEACKRTKEELEKIGDLPTDVAKTIASYLATDGNALNVDNALQEWGTEMSCGTTRRYDFFEGRNGDADYFNNPPTFKKQPKEEPKKERRRLMDAERMRKHAVLKDLYQ